METRWLRHRDMLIGMPLDGEKKKVRCHLINCILVHAKVAIVSKKRVAHENNSATLGLKTASKWMHHRRERARKPRKPLRFEEEPCSWTVHVAVRDSIERELIFTPSGHVDSPGASKLSRFSKVVRASLAESG